MYYKPTLQRGERMKRKIVLMVALLLLLTSTANAIQGDNGYEGGISSGGLPEAKSYDYREIVFITGQPVEFSGKLVVSRSEKSDSETITYRYTLTHGDNDRLTRTVQLDTKVTKKDNQIVRETLLKSRPVETIVIDGTTYSLDPNSTADFSMSIITDDRPAADYFAGNWNGKKTYRSGNDDRITVTSVGELYGYDQHWGSAETQEIKLFIEAQTGTGDDADNWGGTVDIKISSTSTQKLLYVDNRPNEISFEGGYLQRQENNSYLNYTARLPEFDADGVATDRMVTLRGDAFQQSFPQQKRLIVPDLKKIKGHWYEKDVQQLYSLEVFDGDPNDFMPNQYMTRAEFAKAIALAGKIPMEQEEENQRVNPRLLRGREEEEETSPYIDVPLNHPYYQYIDALYENGTMAGVGQDRFNPDDIITRAQALTIFIRILGFESIAPNPGAVTPFRDNDYIPDWARNSVAVASYIGLVRGDEYGNLHPNDPMTKAEAAAFLNRLINYMRHDIVRDYRDRVFVY